MKKNNNIRSGRHVIFNLHVHLVFVTKYRKIIFSKKILEHLNSIFRSVCFDFGSELIEFNGEKDHVHLMVLYPPKVSISTLVNSLKGVSSRLIRKENYSELRGNFFGRSLWSPSYFAGSCGGAPITIIRQYIQNQCSPD